MDQNIRQPDRCPFSAFFFFLFSCFFYGPAKEAGIETINRISPFDFFRDWRLQEGDREAEKLRRRTFTQTRRSNIDVRYWKT